MSLVCVNKLNIWNGHVNATGWRLGYIILLLSFCSSEHCSYSCNGIYCLPETKGNL